MDSGPAVLVLDDDLAVASELACALEMTGWRAVVAHSVAEARSAVARDPAIGLIVSDLRMPGGSGLDLFGIGSQGVWGERPIPFVLITGHATAEDVQKAQVRGVASVIRKPFRLNELISAIHDALAAEETLAETRSTAGPRFGASRSP